MLLPIFQPRTPPHRRARADSPAAPAPAITVVSVTADGAFAAVWVFSAPVALGGGNVPELEIDGEGLGFIGPDYVMQIGPATLRGDYSSASGIVAGDAWRILTQPPSLSPALLIPQSGTCI